MRHVRTRLGIMFAAVAVPLVIASAAYACAVLTTLLLDPGRGRPGDTITATGHNYSVDPTTTNVEIRWNRRNGDVLWSGRPNADRTISASFAVPNVAPGDYVVLATQYKANGEPVAGTPGRASLKVRAADGTRAVLAPVAGKGEGTGPSLAFEPAAARSLSPALLVLAFGGIGMILLTSLYWRFSGRAAVAPREVA